MNTTGARQRPRKASFTHEGIAMLKEYDFSNARKNPCVSRLKKQVTIRLTRNRSLASSLFPVKWHSLSKLHQSVPAQLRGFASQAESRLGYPSLKNKMTFQPKFLC
jgi:hypothetical protein